MPGITLPVNLKAIGYSKNNKYIHKVMYHLIVLVIVSQLTEEDLQKRVNHKESGKTPKHYTRDNNVSN